MNTRSGFTLIELLVAMTIFAIMSAIAYGGLNNVLLARDQTDTHAEQLHQLQFALNWLERDIDYMVDRGVRSEYGEALPSVIGNDFEGYAIELTRSGWNNPANQARSTLQRVAYAVRDEKLVRAYWRVLDRAQDSKPYENVLMDGVKSMEIRYLASDNEWYTSWPPQLLGSTTTQSQVHMPKAVEVNIDTKQFGKITRLLSTGL